MADTIIGLILLIVILAIVARVAAVAGSQFPERPQESSERTPTTSMTPAERPAANASTGEQQPGADKQQLPDGHYKYSDWEC